jgi:hypothetical protein
MGLSRCNSLAYADRLSEFVPFFVNGRGAPGMTYGAYFDESERLKDGEPLCVAGLC